jgi:hypothetical protein
VEAAFLVAMIIPLSVAVVLSLVMPRKQWQAEQEQARARRLAEARMNARLLRFNI